MAHHYVGPSGAGRWGECTPSALLESKVADKSGPAAEEGTLAHALGELLLKKALNRISEPEYTTELLGIMASKYYSESMLEYMEGYRDFMLDKYFLAQKITPDAVFDLEQVLDLSAYIEPAIFFDENGEEVVVEGGFGTVDGTIIPDGILDITDLKFGKGVLVSAIENKQMMIYALGAHEKYGMAYDIREVTMTIYQPRLYNYSTYTIDIEELLKWGEEYLRPRARLAVRGEGEFKPGKHCHFCKVASTCRALAEHNLKLLDYDFLPAPLLDKFEVSEILGKMDGLIKWAKTVKDHAFNETLSGEKYPGWKLVRGRSNRAYSDPVKIAEVVEANGWPEDQIYEKSLKGITAMEKLIGKKTFAELLDAYIVKPPGKPTLVPEEDLRNEFIPGGSDFDDSFEFAEDFED